MNVDASEQKILYPSLTNPKISVTYGKGNITDIIKSLILHDIDNHIDNDDEVKNVENR